MLRQSSVLIRVRDGLKVESTIGRHRDCRKQDRESHGLKHAPVRRENRRDDEGLQTAPLMSERQRCQRSVCSIHCFSRRAERGQSAALENSCATVWPRRPLNTPQQEPGLSCPLLVIRTRDHGSSAWRGRARRDPSERQSVRCSKVARPLGYAFRARVIPLSLKSMPTTSQPLARNCPAVKPLPQPTSSTRKQV